MLLPTNLVQSPRARVYEMLRKKHRMLGGGKADTSKFMKYDSDAFAESNNLQKVNLSDESNESISKIISFKNAKNTDIVVFAILVLIFASLFVVFGQLVDSYIQQYVETHNEIESSVQNALLVLQILFDVMMIIVPFIIISMYYPNTLIQKYYLLVAAFWVVTLQAQPYLRTQLRNAFGLYDELQEPSSKVSTNSSNTKDNDIIQQQQSSFF